MVSNFKGLESPIRDHHGKHFEALNFIIKTNTIINMKHTWLIKAFYFNFNSTAKYFAHMASLKSDNFSEKLLTSIYSPICI